MSSVSFLATIPSIQTAIKISGDGGARIQLDVPDSEMAEIAALIGLRGVVLRVTVEVETLKNSKEQQDDEGKTIPAGAKRKSQWAAAKKPGLDRDTQDSGE